MTTLQRLRLAFLHMPLWQKITFFVTFIVASAVAIVGATAAWTVADNLERSVGKHMLDLAKMVSRMPDVRDGFASPSPQEALRPVADQVRRATGADVVAIVSVGGINYAHTDPELEGRSYEAGDLNRALGGEAFVTRTVGVGQKSPTIRGMAPIFDVWGRQIGVAVVGMYVNSLAIGASQVRTTLFLSLGVALLLGSAGALVLARNIKGALFGLEPREIATLLQQREAMLQSIHEGIIAIDHDGRITLINEAAQNLLGITNAVVGQPVEEAVPHTRLPEVLQTGQPEFDHEQLMDKTMIFTNLVPIRVGNEVVGAIATFRDRTEIANLAEELTGVKQFAEALRAQSHEFQNRLHAISGLIQLQEYDEAVQFISQITQQRQDRVNFLQGRIREPAAAGLLMGKLSEAEERGVQATIDPESELWSLPPHFDTHALVTVLGNLIENAVDAVATQPPERRRVHTLLKETPDEILLVVEDTGTGIPQELVPHVFERGVSTKPDERKQGRGIGLFLVKREVDAARGTITVRSQGGQGTRFEVRIPKVLPKKAAPA